MRAGRREKEESGGYQLRRAGRGPHLFAAERRTSHCLSPVRATPPPVRCRPATRGCAGTLPRFPRTRTHPRTHSHMQHSRRITSCTLHLCHDHTSGRGGGDYQHTQPTALPTTFFPHMDDTTQFQDYTLIKGLSYLK